MHRLPVEIIEFIVEFVKSSRDYRTLASLALVNKSLCERARSILYHTLSSLENNTTFGATPQCLKDFPHLGRYVLTCTIQHTLLVGHRGTHIVDNALLFPERVSEHLVNLKDLSIKKFDHGNVLNFETIPFQLDRFCWNDCNAFLPLLTFLKTQSELRRLEIGFSYNPFTMEFSLTHCPKIEYLEGNRGMVEVILPGRKVSILLWEVTWSTFHNVYGSLLSKNSLKNLAVEFSHLKAL
ncbi:hypothetical protein NLJ89_g6002 [Agrocybe chaxingu]|uniref:F-box domain-containing protein n=1 Tax=Agrocybe chaxingu TaxID=84603 RepID=A0A9W8K7A9_9AGAR|nr:hypothetical protein NLJ89_g6002 [Agrocybe chaxingu]